MGGGGDSESEDESSEYESYSESDYSDASYELVASKKSKQLLISVCTSISVNGMQSFYDGGDGRDDGDGIGVVPFLHWSADYEAEVAVNDKYPARFRGMLEGYDQFENGLFGLAAQEAFVMDPQQRMLLTNTLRVFKASGEGSITPDCFSGVAVSSMEYDTMMSYHTFGAQLPAFRVMGNTLSVACGRLSYTFSLQGPCISVDTACSSSLMVMSLSYSCLKSEACSSALCFGVNVVMAANVSYAFNMGGMLTIDGRCKTLDQSASGYVRSEACSAVTLTTSTAESCDVYLLSSLGNQDGRSSSLTAPNGPSQTALIKKVLQHANLPVKNYDTLQMHGTGTPLGDPIEMVGGNNALQPAGVHKVLVLSATKSRVGHAETGSGMTSIAATIGYSQDMRCVQLMHLRTMNPYMEMTLKRNHVSGAAEGTLCPKMDQGHASEKKRDDPSLVFGVSAFAFQGSNAHTLLEVYPRGEASNTCSRGRNLDPTTYWYMSPVNKTLESVVTLAKDRVQFHTSLSQSALAWMVHASVHGQHVLPVGLMLEATLSASLTLPSVMAVTKPVPLVGSVAFPAPLVLPSQLVANVYRTAAPAKRTLMGTAALDETHQLSAFMLLDISRKGFTLFNALKHTATAHPSQLVTGTLTSLRVCAYVASPPPLPAGEKRAPTLHALFADRVLASATPSVVLGNMQVASKWNSGFNVHPSVLESTIQAAASSLPSAQHASVPVALAAFCMHQATRDGDVQVSSTSLARGDAARCVIQQRDLHIADLAGLQLGVVKDQFHTLVTPAAVSAVCMSSTTTSAAEPAVGMDAAQAKLGGFGVEFRRTLAQDVLMEDEWDPANDTVSMADLGVDSFSFAQSVLALIPEGVREFVTLHDSVETVMQRLQQLAQESQDPKDETVRTELGRLLAEDVLMDDAWDHANDSKSLRVMDVDEFMFREEVLPSLPAAVRSALTLDDSVDTIVAKVLAL
jgi:3-oxoacyl-(acyl-carrier-protein) synthase